MIDVSHTIKSKSDQLNADDLVSGDLMIQVEGVNVVNDPQQPVQIFYYGCDGKPFKPCLTVRRILIKLWGADASQWANKWMNLYVDPTVSYGKQKNIGGIRVSAMSHIQKSATLKLTIRKGIKQEFRINKIELEQQ